VVRDAQPAVSPERTDTRRFDLTQGEGGSGNSLGSLGAVRWSQRRRTTQEILASQGKLDEPVGLEARSRMSILQVSVYQYIRHSRLQTNLCISSLGRYIDKSIDDIIAITIKLNGAVTCQVVFTIPSPAVPPSSDANLNSKPH
jgi:hypothetical protein